MKGVALMGHCVKLIGWNETGPGRPHWILVNTWGRDWGEYGTFRMDYSVRLLDVNGGIPKPRARDTN